MAVTTAATSAVITTEQTRNGSSAPEFNLLKPRARTAGLDAAIVAAIVAVLRVAPIALTAGSFAATAVASTAVSVGLLALSIWCGEVVPTVLVRRRMSTAAVSMSGFCLRLKRLGAVRSGMSSPSPKKRGPGRPSRASTEATRARILAAAVEQFGRQGRAGASARAIAKEADVSLATVLHHFGDKQGLFEACVRETFTAINSTRDVFIAKVTKASTPLGAIDPIVTTSLDFAFAHRAFIRVILTEAVSSGTVPGAVWAEVDPSLGRIAALISALTQRPVAQIRLLSMTFAHVCGRYAIATPEQLARIVGIDGDGLGEDGTLAPAVREALEAHLRDILRGGLLGDTVR